MDKSGPGDRAVPDIPETRCPLYGRIAVRFDLDETGVPTYCVDVDGQPFLEPSLLGLLSDDANLDRGFSWSRPGYVPCRRPGISPGARTRKWRTAVPKDTVRIVRERTQFAFASDVTSWSIPGDFNSYEHLYRKMLLSELRDANTPLTFLRPGVRYTATVYGDAPEAHWESNPTAYEITTRSVTCEDTLTLRLAPGGGAAVSFLPE